jgi:hypothetical protein
MSSVNRKERRLAGHRQFVAIVGAILADGLEAVEAACQAALRDGPCGSDVVLNILARRPAGAGGFGVAYRISRT